jgi:hypothetical protein
MCDASNATARIKGDASILAVPLPPLRLIGKFVASSALAVAEFAALNAAARECMFGLGLVEATLPAAMANDAAAHATTPSVDQLVQRAVARLTRQPESAQPAVHVAACDDERPPTCVLAHWLVECAQRQGLAVRALLIHSCRRLKFRPLNWSLRAENASFDGVTGDDVAAGDVTVSRGGVVIDDGRYAGELSVHLGGGCIDFTCIPRRVTAWTSVNADLCGPLLWHAQSRLQTLNLSMNPKFGGQLHVAQLPRTLTRLLLMRCGLTGSVDLSALPPTLAMANLCWNQLDGVVDVSSLPASLQTLNLSRNALRQLVPVPVVTSRLPPSLRLLLSENAELEGRVHYGGCQV